MPAGWGAVKVIINPGGCRPALPPALLASRDYLHTACRGSAPEAGSARLTRCLQGEEDHSRRLNFSLRFADRFPEMLERGEGIGSRICRGEPAWPFSIQLQS